MNYLLFLFIFQILQKDIESKNRNISAVLRLSELLHNDLEESIKDEVFPLQQLALDLQQKWHEIWLESLEVQCRLENALKGGKKVCINIKVNTFINLHYC